MFAQNYYDPNLINQNMYYGGYPQGYPPQTPPMMMGGYGNYGFMNNPMNPPSQFGPYNPYNDYQQPQAPTPMYSSVGGGYTVSAPSQDMINDPNSPFFGYNIQEYVPGRNVTAIDSNGNEIPVTRNGVNVNPHIQYDFNESARIQQQIQRDRQQQSGFVYEGGYNPVTRTLTPENVPLNPAGNNPYNAYGYNPPQRVYQLPPHGFVGYTNYYNPYAGYYAQTQFDEQLNLLLYDAPIEAFDIRDSLRNIVMTPAELEEMRRRQTRGYYNDYYSWNNKVQAQIEEARQNQINVMTSLSRIAHVAAGEKFDDEMEAKANYIYDPMREYNERNKRIQKEREEYYNNPEKQEYVAQMQRVAYTNNLAVYEASLLNMEAQRHEKVLALCKAIQDGHSKIMGFKPGEHYSLQDYLDNAGIIYVRGLEEDEAYRRFKERGKGKFNLLNFKTSLSSNSNKPVQLTKDDVPFAEDNPIMKMRANGLYKKDGKDIYPMIALPDGSVAYGIAPPGRDQEEYIKSLFEQANKNKHDRLFPAMEIPGGVRA